MIKFELRYKYGPNLTSPYDICDGNWGGFGPVRWFRGDNLTGKFPDKNVYELGKTIRILGTAYVIQFWGRVWDVAAEKWRELTAFEHFVITYITYQPVFKIAFTKIRTPKFLKSTEELRTYNMNLREVITENSLKDKS